MTRKNLEEYISASVKASMVKALDHGSDNFVELAKVAGLDPKNDFRFADLQGVNFTNCSLVGFDFTGADLRNTFGENVRWDETTILADAQLDGSPFKYPRHLESEYRSNPENEKEFRRIANADSLDQAAWIQNVSSSARNEKANRAIVAQKIMLETKSSFVQSSMMFSLTDYFATPKDRKEFLLFVIASRSRSGPLFERLIEVLSQLYRDDAEIFDVFFKTWQHGGITAKHVAGRAMRRSVFYEGKRAEIENCLKSAEFSEYRRFLLWRAVRSFKDGEVRSSKQDLLFATTDPDRPREAFDWMRPITPSQLMQVMQSMARQGKRAEIMRRQSGLDVAKTQQERERRMRELTQITISDAEAWSNWDRVALVWREIEKTRGISVTLSQEALDQVTAVGRTT